MPTLYWFASYVWFSNVHIQNSLLPRVVAVHLCLTIRSTCRVFPTVDSPNRVSAFKIDHLTRTPPDGLRYFCSAPHRLEQIPHPTRQKRSSLRLSKKSSLLFYPVDSHQASTSAMADSTGELAPCLLPPQSHHAHGLPPLSAALGLPPFLMRSSPGQVPLPARSPPTCFTGVRASAL
jgi:hypothetical protein